MTAVEIVILVAVILGVIALVMGGALVFVSRLGRRRTAALLAEYPDPVWAEPANSFGLQSEGVMQIRGNGTLLLTRHALVFEMWMPQKRLVIPLNAITELSTPRTFLSKGRGRPLLRVDFKTDDGSADAIAWLVRDLDETLASIQAGRKR